MTTTKEFVASNAVNIFKNIKFYSTGILENKVSEVLKAGGAKSFTYLSGICNLCIVGKDPDNDEVSEAIELLEIPAVTQDWVTRSLNCGQPLPTAAFSPSPDQLMSGVSVSVSGVGRTDACSIWAMVTFYGGQVGTELTAATTHLVATSDQGKIYEEALGRNGLYVVTPDWISDSVSQKIKCNEMIYHPRLLVTSGQKMISRHEAIPCSSTSKSTIHNLQETRPHLEKCSCSSNNNSVFAKPVVPRTSVQVSPISNSHKMQRNVTENIAECHNNGKPMECQNQFANNELPDQTIALHIIKVGLNPFPADEAVSNCKQNKENSQDLNENIEKSFEDNRSKTDDSFLLNDVYSEHPNEPIGMIKQPCIQKRNTNILVKTQNIQIGKKHEKKPKRNEKQEVVDIKANKTNQHLQSKRKVTTHPMFDGAHRNSVKEGRLDLTNKAFVPTPDNKKHEISDTKSNRKGVEKSEVENIIGGSVSMRKTSSKQISIVNPHPSMITMIEDKKKTKKPKLDYENLDTVDPSIIEEQERIEEQIKQQIEDEKFAKQLQNDLEREERLPNEYNLRNSTRKRSLTSQLVSSPRKPKNVSLRRKSKLAMSPKTLGENGVESRLVMSPITLKTPRLGGVKRLRDEAGSSDEEGMRSPMVKKSRKISLAGTSKESSGNESEEF